MYKVRSIKGRVYYFTSWNSACAFCLLLGIRIKHVEVA
jgi:hypothetical protein